MDGERLKHLLATYEAALELPRAARAAFLEEACADPAGRAEIERMLSADESARTSFLESPLDLDPTPPPPAQPPATIGGYRVVRRLAVGGMGVVYEAEGNAPRRRVALKLLQVGAVTPALVRRFQYETEVLARLRHPGIAHLYDSGVETGADGVERPWFAMEFVEEASEITDWANAAGLGLDERLALFARVCDALQHGHGRGVVHRDLKPSNVLVDAQGHVKVIDFGVARALEGDAERSLATRTGEIVGTLTYMSPEQLDAAGEVDTRTDVYGLGLLLYELLCGRGPFELEGKSMAEIARIVTSESPTEPRRIRPDLPRDLSWVLLRALEKEPARRYASAAELAADVRRLLAMEPVQARAPSAVYRFRKFARRNRTLVAAAAVVLLSLFAGGAVALTGLVRAARDAETFRGINAILTETLSAAGIRDEGRDVRVLSLLEDASVKLGEQLAGRPEVEAPLRSTLAGCFLSLGLLGECERESRRAIELWEQFAPEDDPRKLDEMTVLLLCLLENRKDAEFEATLAEALEASRDLPPDSFLSLEFRRFEAMGIARREGFAAALENLEALHQDCVAALGQADPTTFRVHDYRVRALQAAQSPSAIDARRELTALSLELKGADDPLTVEQHILLAGQLGLASQTKEALALYSRWMPRAVELVGEDHNLILGARNSRAITLDLAGRREDAISELADLQEDLERIGSAQSASLLSQVLLNLDALRAALGSEDVDVLQRAFEGALEDDPEGLAARQAMRRLGEGLLAAGERGEAEAVLVELDGWLESVESEQTDDPTATAADASERMRLESALAELALERGDALAALAHLRAAREAAGMAFGPGHREERLVDERLQGVLASLGG